MSTTDTPVEIRPQPAQEKFLSSSADLTFFGGGAFGGKSYAALLDLARWAHLPKYRGVLFRRTRPQITQEGGVWDESQSLYRLLGGRPNQTTLTWRFPSGAIIGMRPCQHEDDVNNYKSMQADVINFEQLEEFTSKQFWYLLSRNRGSSGIRCYVRATYNPQPGWLADLLQWWWDPASGYAIKPRSGVIRWLCRLNDQLHWGSSRDELAGQFSDFPDFDPKTCTFIPATADDNQIGLARNPGYKASLLAMRNVDMERLLKGNHKIRDGEGLEWPAEYFDDHIWFDDDPPRDEVAHRVLALDAAVGKRDNADYTAFTMISTTHDGTRYIDADIRRRDIMTMINDGLAIANSFMPNAWAIELNNFNGLEELFMLASGGSLPPIATIRNFVDKDARIRVGITPYLAAKRLRFRRNSESAKLLVSQLREFPLEKKKDGPDSLEMGLRIAREFDTNGLPQFVESAPVQVYA